MRSPSKRYLLTPVRKYLDHSVPEWVDDNSIYFVSVNTLPRGENHLCHTDIAHGFLESFKHRETLGQWEILVALLMPDHFHMLARFHAVANMKKTMADWKRYLSRRYRIPWQRDFFDHRIRNIASFEDKRSYIRMNPVVAGLVQKPEEWPYLWDRLDD